jgi:Zn-dependent protease
MGLLNLLIKDPIAFLLLSVLLLYSVILHELAHGWIAYRMGDHTAKRAGRLTMNPLPHLDPIGTLMLFLLGFGWAKPVPVDFSYVQNSRKGLIMISSAGIVANMILAFLALLIYQIFSPPQTSVFAKILYYLAQINIMLAAFNLIPIPPLDGSKILMGFTSARVQDTLSRFEPYGFFIIIALLYIGALGPVIAFFRWLILTIIGILLP